MKLKRLFIFLLIILLLGILSIFWPQLTGQSIANSPAEYSKEPAFVIRVIDGDTIELNTSEHIRLLGINTPEKKKPYYQEARDFLINEIENKSIEILRDKTDIDKYNRKLRYVFYNDNFINIEIVQEGLATTFMLEDLKYKDKLIYAEKFAKKNELGLWERSSDICAECIKLVKLEFNAPEYFIIKNNCDFDCNLNGWLVKDDANHFFSLNDLPSGDEKRYDSLQIFKAEVWNDNGDRFFMRDKEGKLVVFYEY